MHSTRALEMLGSPLARYRGFRLRVTCGSGTCRHVGEVRTSDILDRLRAADPHGLVQVQHVVGRLRCGKCGAMPRAVEMRHHMIAEWLLGGDE